MVKYVKIIDENTRIYPYNLVNLKVDFPNTSFSPNSDLSDWDIFPVNIPPRPSDNTKNYTEELSFVDNQWVVNWVATDKTPEELLEQKKTEVRQNKQIDINSLTENLILQSAQQATTNEEIEQYKNVYPLWEDFPDGHTFTVDFKINYIDSNYVVRLFKCIQQHNKESQFTPDIIPALWSEIIFGDNGIEVWTQPIGGDGKYPYIDPLTGNPYRVTHNGFTWENNFTSGLNIWEPGVFGWTQI